MRRVLGRLGLLAGGLLVGLAGAEGLSRLIRPSASADLLFNSPESSPMGLYVIDHTLLLIPRPGFRGQIRSPGYAVDLRINDLSLRGPPVSEVPAETRHWLAVGDSFTMAVQVPEPETFSGKLGAAQGVQVWNAGVDGYSTWQAALRYQEIDDQLPIERVILNFFLGNDFQDNANFPHIAPPPMPEGADIPREPVPFVRGILLRHSRLYAHFRVLSRQRSLTAGSDPDRQRWRDELSIFSTEGSARLEQLIGQSRAALMRLRDAARQRGDALLVAVAPPAFQIETDRAEATFAVVGLDPASMDLQAPRKAVLGLLTELHMSACDLTPALESAARDGAALYFVYDGHWTEAGHAVVADALEACL